jgi:hypothetical protein
MPAEQHLPQRRSFFKKMVMLGGALVLTRLARNRSAGTLLPNAAPPEQAGYRLTRHIRKYYETAAR